MSKAPHEVGALVNAPNGSAPNTLQRRVHSTIPQQGIIHRLSYGLTLCQPFYEEFPNRV